MKPIQLQLPTDPILFVSDFHWDSLFTVFSREEVTTTRSYLEHLITQYQIAFLVVLGDIFIMQETNVEFIREVLEWFVNLPVSRVVILPGNHDRNVGDFLPPEYMQKIYVVKDPSFTLTWHDVPVIYLTHDANGGYFSDPSKPQEFLAEMRETLHVPHGCWLIAGHIHQPFINYAEKALSLGPFSCAAHHLSAKKDLSYSFLISNWQCCLNRYGAKLMICNRSQETTTTVYDIEIGEDLETFTI